MWQHQLYIEKRRCIFIATFCRIELLLFSTTGARAFHCFIYCDDATQSTLFLADVVPSSAAWQSNDSS